MTTINNVLFVINSLSNIGIRYVFIKNIYSTIYFLKRYCIILHNNDMVKIKVKIDDAWHSLECTLLLLHVTLLYSICLGDSHHFMLQYIINYGLLFNIFFLNYFIYHIYGALPNNPLDDNTITHIHDWWRNYSYNTHIT